MRTPTLQSIPLSAIQRTARNPRRDPETDLEGLAASLLRLGQVELQRVPRVLGDRVGRERIVVSEIAGGDRPPFGALTRPSRHVRNCRHHR